MPPKSWGPLSGWLNQLILLLFIGVCAGTDVFCGQLTVYKQQWFEKSTQTLGARMSVDLKDCLNFCCGIPDCQAVTFMGFLKNSANPTANCVMFTCGNGGECKTVTEPIATDGVVSVVIKRDASTPAQLESKDDTAVAEMLSNSTQPASNQTMADPAVETTPKDENTPAPTVVFGDDDEGSNDNNGAPEPTKSKKTPAEPQQNSTNTSAPRTRSQPRATTTQAPVAVTTESTFLSDLAPVWVIGILIVITVTCAGTCLVLLSVYFCVRRSKTKMRSQPITSLKTGTLHAFNPTTLHTTSTMA